MKNFYALLAFIMLGAIIHAQTPNKLSYQAVVRNAEGELITSQIGLRISILEGPDPETASEVYSETLLSSPNSNGLISVQFGGESGWEAITWADGIFYIHTEIDIDNNSTYDVISTSQLLSVPYALHAKTVDSYSETDPVFTAWNKDYADLINTPTTITSGQIDSIQINRANINALLNRRTITSGQADSIVMNTNDILDLENRTTITPGQTDSIKMNAISIADLTSRLNNIEEILINAGLFTTLRDIDNNEYDIVQIGDQIWMADNLAVTRYADGTPLDIIVDTSGNGTADDEWFAMGEYASKYCWYNDDIGYKETDGALYTYMAAVRGDTISTLVQGVCPNGWHVPSLHDWAELETYVQNDGHPGTEGESLKCTSGWNNDGNGTDDYHFTVIPGGERMRATGESNYHGSLGRFWTSSKNHTESDEIHAYFVNFGYGSSGMYLNPYYMKIGLNVRCIKD